MGTKWEPPLQMLAAATLRKKASLSLILKKKNDSEIIGHATRAGMAELPGKA
jgi:hypothetical protein